MGCFSKPICHPRLVSSFYLSCGQVPSFYLDTFSQLLTRLQSAPVKQMVKMVRKIWLEPLRLRPQNGTAVWKVNIQKSFSDHVIQNTRPCTAGSHAVKPVSQSVPTHLKYQEAMKDFTTLACRTIPPSGDIGKLIVHFCLFLLFLFCAFQFQYSNGVTLPQMIAFLSCILPCQLILSILSDATLHKCMTFSCSFSCSSVVMPHSDSLPNFHCGNRGMFLVWLLWAKRVWFQRNILPIAMCHWVQQEAGEVWK